MEEEILSPHRCRLWAGGMLRAIEWEDFGFGRES